jgi:hypothetical protein
MVEMTDKKQISKDKLLFPEPMLSVNIAESFIADIKFTLIFQNNIMIIKSNYAPNNFTAL